MMIKKNKVKKVFSYVMVAIISSVLSVGMNNPFGFFAYKQLMKMNEVVKLIKFLYYEKFDENILAEGAMYGASKSLDDPYTEYMNEKVTKDFEKSIDGKFSGIGVYISKDEEGFVYVVNSIDDSPAKRSGINGGERILFVDDKEIKTIEEASECMLGEVGSTLNLTILKPGTTDVEKITLTRGNILVRAVSHKVIDDIGYIKVTQFSNNVFEEFKESLDALKNENIDRIIMDFRDNPGGTIEGVIGMLDLFIEQDKVLVYTIDKKGKRFDYVSKPGPKYDCKISILVNERSASASEVFVGAMKDYEKAVIVGRKTFGKGVVQQLIRISDHSSLKVTVSRYYTPNGNSIDKKGIEPDICISNENLGSSSDGYVAAAIETLKNS